MTNPRRHRRVSTNSAPITAQGIEESIILKETGIPAVFADILKKLSIEKNIAFAIRGGFAFQRYLMPCAPKPVTVKAKTGNWGFTKGVIAVNPTLGKVEWVNDVRVIKPRDDKKELPQDPKILHEVLHKLSLREIMAEVEKGELILEKISADRLILTAQFSPDANSIEFSINLTEKTTRTTPQINIPEFTPTPVAEPEWWQADKWGEFNTALDIYFPAQCRDTRAAQSEFSDIYVYGVEEQGEIKPISGDQDLLWISRPVAAFAEFAKVFNTFKVHEVEVLVRDRINLALQIARTAPEQLSELLKINNSSIARLGCVTAFESYVIDEANKAFASFMTFISDLFQHGTENRNPGQPSPIDELMVHVYKGKVSVTHDEDELIDFVLQPGYLEENIIDIHPQWNMEKWEPIIAKQISLAQPIPAATLQAYNDYKGKENLTSTGNIVKQIKVTEPKTILRRQSEPPQNKKTEAKDKVPKKVTFAPEPAPTPIEPIEKATRSRRNTR